MNVVNDGPTGERPTGCQVISQEAMVDLSQVKGPSSRAENESQPANGTCIQQESPWKLLLEFLALPTVAIDLSLGRTRLFCQSSLYLHQLSADTLGPWQKQQLQEGKTYFAQDFLGLSPGSLVPIHLGRMWQQEKVVEGSHFRETKKKKKISKGQDTRLLLRTQRKWPSLSYWVPLLKFPEPPPKSSTAG